MNVLYSLYTDYCLARPYPVDRLKRSPDYSGADLVDGRSHGDFTLDSSLVVVQIHIDVSDASGTLQFAQLQILSEQTLGLPKDRSDDILASDCAVRLDSRVNHVFSFICHFHFFPAVSRPHSGGLALFSPIGGQ